MSKSLNCILVSPVKKLLHPPQTTNQLFHSHMIINEAQALKHIFCLFTGLFPDHIHLFIQRSFTTRPRMELPWQLNWREQNKKIILTSNEKREARFFFKPRRCYVHLLQLHIRLATFMHFTQQFFTLDGYLFKFKLLFINNYLKE